MGGLGARGDRGEFRAVGGSAGGCACRFNKSKWRVHPAVNRQPHTLFYSIRSPKLLFFPVFLDFLQISYIIDNYKDS